MTGDERGVTKKAMETIVEGGGKKVGKRRKMDRWFSSKVEKIVDRFLYGANISDSFVYPYEIFLSQIAKIDLFRCVLASL